MKTRFTNSITRTFLFFCVLSIGIIGGLQAQNSVNQNNANGSAGQLAIGSSNTTVKLVLNPDNTLAGKVLSGKLIFSDSLKAIKGIYDIGAVADFDPSNIDLQALQFDISQDNVAELYKLLQLYKSESGNGHTIVVLTRKNQTGQAVDTINIVFKYVVADDLLGFLPPVPVDAVGPGVLGSKINNSSANTNFTVLATALAGFEMVGQTDLSGLVSLYPNPAQNSITVDLGSLSGSDIRIYNVQGKLVKTIQSSLNLPQQKIDVSDLPSGLYFLNIDSENGQAVKEFSKIN